MTFTCKLSFCQPPGFPETDTHFTMHRTNFIRMKTKILRKSRLFSGRSICIKVFIFHKKYFQIAFILISNRNYKKIFLCQYSFFYVFSLKFNIGCSYEQRLPHGIFWWWIIAQMNYSSCFLFRFLQTRKADSFQYIYY